MRSVADVFKLVRVGPKLTLCGSLPDARVVPLAQAGSGPRVCSDNGATVGCACIAAAACCDACVPVTRH